MIHRYYKALKLRVRKVLSDDWIGKLDKIESEIRKNERTVAPRQLRVLIGPSFAIHNPCFFMDRALSYAFRLRGAEVVPIYCDGVQYTECNYIGGNWGGGKSFNTNCVNCQQTSEQLWKHSPIKPLPLSQYVSGVDRDRIYTMVSCMSYEDAATYVDNGIDYGRMAKDILVNNYLVATPSLIDGYEALIKVHLGNLLVVSLAYSRIIDEQKPDRVVSNDSFYGMWAVLEKQCHARSIPFYSHYPVTINRIAFAHNDAAMNLDFTKSWGLFSKEPFSREDEEKIDIWLAGNRGYVIDTTKLAGHESDEPILKQMDAKKPTLIIAANVIWDLAALDKQILFKDMNDWIIKTIEWFRGNQSYQLIIRPHPVEMSPMIPKTKETVASAIEVSGVSLPKNVFLLKPDAKVTFGELIKQFMVRGVAVHTTTVGFECPARGIPIITTAKSCYRGFGFTIDPESQADYFAAIDQLLAGSQKTVSQEEQLLAKKFINFYHFHYYIKTGLFVGNPPEFPNDLIRKLGDDDGAFGYVVKAILDGTTINGRDRWAPET